MGKSLLIRWGIALVLVLLTYNPTSFNFVRWAMNTENGSLPVVVLSGLVLAVGYIIFFRATFRSIGVVGHHHRGGPGRGLPVGALQLGLDQPGQPGASDLDRPDRAQLHHGRRLELVDHPAAAFGPARRRRRGGIGPTCAAQGQYLIDHRQPGGLGLFSRLEPTPGPKGLMENIVLTVHLLIALALILTVLLQRSEGWTAWGSAAVAARCRDARPHRPWQSSPGCWRSPSSSPAWH